MLRKIGFVLLPIILGVASSSCSRKPTVADAKRMLQGRWQLKLGHDCQGYGIRSDELILHSDGRLEQHFVSIYDQHYDATDERWSYLPDNSINFDSRRNFFSTQPKSGVIGTSMHETLLIEFGDPSLILINPDSDCFYRKTGDQ
jgi:hypothetical protein